MTYDPADVMPWIKFDPPVWWRAAGRYVIADRHLPDGTRQHMVEGTVPPGTVIDNAQVIGAEGSDAELESATTPEANHQAQPRRQLRRLRSRSGRAAG